MKKAAILHGTDGNPDSNWFPWIKGKLEERGYEVWTPHLPNSHAPNRQAYSNFLLASGHDFTDNIVIGHSSGAVAVLNLLMDKRCPRIKLGALVSAWDHGTPNGMESEQFDSLFPDGGFDFGVIKQKAEKIVVLHSSDDPYCPIEQAVHLANRLSAPLTVIQNGSHLGDNFKELLPLWRAIIPSL